MNRYDKLIFLRNTCTKIYTTIYTILYGSWNLIRFLHAFTKIMNRVVFPGILNWLASFYTNRTLYVGYMSYQLIPWILFVIFYPDLTHSFQRWFITSYQQAPYIILYWIFIKFPEQKTSDYFAMSLVFFFYWLKLALCSLLGYIFLSYYIPEAIWWWLRKLLLISFIFSFLFVIYSIWITHNHVYAEAIFHHTLHKTLRISRWKSPIDYENYWIPPKLVMV
jgi:hypothetical protein